MRARPWWMTALAVVCVAALLMNVARDLFLPDARDVEVWFGFEARGRLAILTAPIHWAILAVGAWAFWTRRRWIAPWAGAYLLYAAVSHLVWSEASPHGRGWLIGLAQAAVISLFALLLIRAGTRLDAPTDTV